MPHPDEPLTEAPECKPLHDAIAMLPGVFQVEDGWRYRDGRWRVGFDVTEDAAGCHAVHLVAWTVRDTATYRTQPLAVELNVEAYSPPRPGPRALTFVLAGEGDP